MPLADKQCFRADLHIHTCLSPCGDWEMTPQRIIKRARELNLDILAICDHNSSKNARPIVELGKTAGILVLPGLEICTREEVHLLGIHKRVHQAEAVADEVYQGLVQENTPDIFGFQVIADEQEMVVGQEPKLLIQACHLTVKEAVDLIHREQGLAIAAHIDRPSYSILGQLGFIPPDLGLDGIEITARTMSQGKEHYFLDKTSPPCLVSSDAHRLVEMAQGSTLFTMTCKTFEAMASALKKGNTEFQTRGFRAIS
ncbi:MAG: PHP-associated domain-containing protein [Desulfobacterium sp.]|nr:PHP-associated domain-containing protein [Desulfobacterium sp.]